MFFNVTRYVLASTQNFPFCKASSTIFHPKMLCLQEKKISENMSDPEPCKIKDEDTEEQRGWCLFLILH